jgi:hypothetical protein
MALSQRTQRLLKRGLAKQVISVRSRGYAAHTYKDLPRRVEDSQPCWDGPAWWRSERRIRAAAGDRVRGGHVPEAEVWWPDAPGSGYAGECWAIEAQLTPCRWLARLQSWLGYWPAPSADLSSAPAAAGTTPSPPTRPASGKARP